jgi:tetratricopeptide (TPR) repeat protein/tRNA A-37 threonylcarbamoyl transferase component Bud32
MTDPAAELPATTTGAPFWQSLLSDQRTRWGRGERIRVEDYLSRHEGLHADAEAVLNLIANEVLLRQQLGESPEVGDYLQRFPQWAEQLLAQLDPGQTVPEGTDPRAGTFSASLPEAPPPPTRFSGPPAVPGYEILGVLGRGGMGIVYKARDQKLDRIVALKMIQHGGDRLEALLERLRVEAEVLARLQHPNIVQIFELDSHEGLPFLALEYVPGGSLAHKIAGVPQPAATAAQLVEVLARAMHAAHQCGVLHRDLKPDNVLLTADGAVKITDFGLAKRLDGPIGQTVTGQVLGTASYMAPEQAEGNVGAVGVAADTYALGGILYALLTGRPPFRAATFLDTLWQVKTEEPVPPSRLAPRVPRDLETICLKCLHKEPAKRYGSALELADDLRRFLDGKPVMARPVAAWERAVRWASRHPAGAALMAVCVAAVFSLAAGLAWHTAQLREANSRLQGALKEAEELAEERRRQYERAEANLDKAGDVVDEMVSWMGHQRLANVPQMEQARRDVLEKAVKLHQSLRGENGLRERSRLGIALALDRLAESCRLLGRRDEAEKAQRQAIEMHERLVDDFPRKGVYCRNLAISYHNLSIQLGNAGRLPEAEKSARRAIELLDGLVQAFPDEPAFRSLLANGHNNLGVVLQKGKRFREAEKAYREALAIQEKLAGPKADMPARRGLAMGYNSLGHLLGVLGQAEESKKAMRKAISLLEQLVADHPSVAPVRQDLAGSLFNLAIVLRGTNRLPESEKPLRRAVELREGLVRDFPTLPDYRRELAWSQYLLCGVLYTTKRSQEAQSLHHRLLANHERLIGDFPAVAGYRQSLAFQQRTLVEELLKEGQRDEAEKAARAALAFYEKLAGRFPQVSEWRTYQAEIKTILSKQPAKGSPGK